MTIIICPCDNKFLTTDYRIGLGRGKYCSKKCCYKFRKLRPTGLHYTITKANKGWYKKGHVLNVGKNNPNYGKPPWNKGTKGVMKISSTSFTKGSQSGSNNINWKGDGVGYAGVHSWLTRRLGQPKYCKECNKRNKGIYHWHNLSKKYTRDFSDWIRLCHRCHYKYERHNFSYR